MNKHTIKNNAEKAGRSAVQLDICISALSSEIRRLESNEKEGDVNYTAVFLDGIKEMLNHQIDHLFQIKHDLNIELETDKQK